MGAPKVTRAQKAKEKRTDKTIIAKGKSLPRGEVAKKRKKPGMSSLGKWKNVKKGDFAGPEGTFPIMDLAHARNALSRAHYAENPAAIRKNVYAKYPQLKKRKKEREGKSSGKR